MPNFLQTAALNQASRGVESSEYRCELDQVSPGIGQERQPTTDGGQLEWLGDDGHAAATQLRERCIDAGHVEAEVMEACQAQTVTQILIDRLGNRFVAGWFEGGKDDPKLCLLRFDPGSAEVWKDASSLVAGVKMFLGMGDPKEDYKDDVAKVKLGRN